QTLIVNRANQTIIFAPLPEKTYGDADFNITATASSGLPVSFSSSNTSVATVTGNSVHIVGAGTTIITASQPGNENYNPASDVQQTLIVNRANQTIIFAPLPEKTYGDADFNITATASSGLPVSFSSSNTSVATVTGNLVHIAGAGTTTISASQPGNENYNPAQDVEQILTINKAGQTITIIRSPETMMITDTFRLQAITSSGLPVSFESSNTAVVSVSGNTLTALAKGTASIRAFNNGNSNYLPAETSFSVEVTTTHKEIMHLFTPNGDGINDYWELPQLSEWGRCEVKVYNRWGKLVYDNPDYNNLWDGTSNGNPLPEGAYYFIIKTQNAGTVKGTVNIIR
ncbi:MAG TPA: gliding motility-associated C-terminal domain-containing protein, partial [Bacteroidales bacterium]|nr:gliding motility-associated C-terminal domain-containing protein [Bacteroidales bacterium]